MPDELGRLTAYERVARCRQKKLNKERLDKKFVLYLDQHLNRISPVLDDVYTSAQYELADVEAARKEFINAEFALKAAYNAKADFAAHRKPFVDRRENFKTLAELVEWTLFKKFLEE